MEVNKSNVKNIIFVEVGISDNSVIFLKYFIIIIMTFNHINTIFIRIYSCMSYMLGRYNEYIQYTVSLRTPVSP